jgi:hypothetical protein
VNSPHSRMIQLVQATIEHANPRRNSDLGGGAFERAVQRFNYWADDVEHPHCFLRKETFCSLSRSGNSATGTVWSVRGDTQVVEAGARSLQTRIHEQKLGDTEKRLFLY